MQELGGRGIVAEQRRFEEYCLINQPESLGCIERESAAGDRPGLEAFRQDLMLQGYMG